MILSWVGWTLVRQTSEALEISLSQIIVMAVVTSFDTARRHVSLLDDIPWTVLVVDEAHRLKNPKSRTTRALASFYWPENHTIPGHVTELTPVSESRPSASPQSLWAQPSASIPRTGPIRIALTGTAIQNSYMELWTLLDWANPGSVGSEKQWKNMVAKPLAAGQARGGKEEERLRANGIAEMLRDKLLPLYFLRRYASGYRCSIEDSDGLI
jgi:SNF2 family DNA or RNA helicase